MKFVFVLLIALLPAVEALAAQCSAVFSSAVQGHSGSGVLTMSSNATISNAPSTVLPFANGVINATNGVSCVSAECTVSGVPSEQLSLTTFPTFSGGSSFSTGTTTLGEGSFNTDTFDSVTVSSGTLTFSNNFDEYFIDYLAVEEGAVVEFKPGTYWIGQLNLSKSNSGLSAAVRITGTGTIYVNVQENLSVNGARSIDGIETSAVLNLNSYGDLALSSDSQASGVFYVQGDVVTNSGSIFTGSLSAANVTMNSDAVIDYADLTSSYDFSQLCEVEKLVANYLFDETSWPNAGSVIDSAGSSDGSPVGNVVPGSIGSCGVLDVPSNTSEAQQDAINTNLDINDVGNAGTISFWYRSNESWSSSTARQLFDASNEAPSLDKHFYLVLENGTLEFGPEDEDDDGIFVQATGLSFAADQWVHIAVTWDLAENRVQMYLNSSGSSRVVSRSQSSFNGNLGDMDTLYIGDNRSGYRVGNSTVNSADGQFEDFRIYNFVRSSAEISSESSTQPACADPDPEPVAHWPIDVCSVDGSVDEIVDIIGGANGQSKEGADIEVDGQYCQAGDFAGNGQHINIPHDSAFEIDDGSLSFWFKAPDLSHTDESSRGGMALFSKDSNGTDNGGFHLTIWLDSDGSVFVRHQNNSNSFTIDSSAGVVSENQWHYLVYTFGSGGMKLFIDTVEEGSNGSFTGGLSTNPEPIILASNAWQTDNSSSPSSQLRDHFQGQIDDLRLYDVELTEAQISNLNGIAEGDCEACIFEDTLEAYWPIDVCSVDGTSGEIVDIENGYNGTTIDGAGIANDGKFCQAGDFAGTGAHVNIPHQSAFKTPSGAISFWFNTPDLSHNNSFGRGGQGLFSIDSLGFDSGGHLTLWLQENGSVFVRHQDDNSTNSVTSPVQISENTWHHLVYTWGNDGMILYLDGAEVATNSGFTGGTEGNLEPIILGAAARVTGNGTSDPEDLNDFFQGQLDDVRFYSNQIESDTVDELFNQADYSCSSCEVTPLAFYQFEEETWTGSGAVLDSSDNTRDGTAVNIAGSAIPDEAISCRVLDVPANTSASTFEAIDTGLDMNDVGNRGTISFWYRSNLDWNDATPRQLFDASNTAPSLDKYFFLNLRGGTLQFGLEDSSDNDETITESGLTYAADEWVHIAVTWDLIAQRTEIYLGGTLVNSDDNIGLNSTLGDMETLYIGDNRSNYFVSNSSEYSANGQFDDVRIYSVVQSASDISADMDALSPCSFVDHYEITQPGNALTCEAANITIKACTNADCSEVYDEDSSVTISPFNVPVTIPANSTAGLAVDIRQTTVGTQSFSITDDDPVADNLLVCIGGPVSDTCEIEFANAGFDIYGANVGDGIMDQVAESLFTDVNIRAVEDVNGVCVPTLDSQTIDITFTHTCSDPGSCKTPLEYNGTSLNSSANISITFDSDGTANLPSFIYSDAGQIQLAATATLPDGTLIESGNELILVYPDSIDISGTATTENTDAGADFALEIKALGAQGGVLPNYVPGNLQFQLTSNIGPTFGELTYASGQTISSSNVAQFVPDSGIDIAAGFSGNNGVYSYQANYSEVDQLTFDVRDSNYFGQVINTDNPQTLGLFVPAYFDVEVASQPQFANLCEPDSATPTFTYFGQEFGFANAGGAGTEPQLNFTARNANGDITQNYRGGYWNWLPVANELDAISFTEADGNYTESIDNVTGSASGSSSDIVSTGIEYGRRQLSISGMQLVYNKPANPREPLSSDTSMTFPAALLSDTTYAGNTICLVTSYDKNNPGSCEDFVVNNITGAELRWGRIALENAFGPENENLLMQVRTEYFDGAGFIRNRDDQCTSFVWAETDFNKTDRSTETGYSDITGQVTVSGSFTMLSGLSQGMDGIGITAPTNGERGELLIELLPDGNWDSYLQFDWDDDVSGIQGPSAIATFGQFRGNDRIIHWREVF